ncbi:MAG: hypothetical protein LVQ95_00235 [Candidatus Micrarchaeales archaeon]|nr:hypothetical protein [Candidatus Micrarchaeales archaeon]
MEWRKKIYLIDVDGTLCEDIKNEEGTVRMLKAKPLMDSIAAINRLYDEGHYICIFTARTDEHKEVTEKWLKEHNVKYHQIMVNKPRKAGKYSEYHWIDDAKVRATTYKGAFTKLVKKTAEVVVFED